MRERPAPCLRFCVFLKKGLVFCADKCYNEIDGRKDNGFEQGIRRLYFGTAFGIRGRFLPSDDGGVSLVLSRKNRGIYLRRAFFGKATDSAKALLPSAPSEPPYEGAKEMLLVEDVDDKELLQRLFERMYDELPALRRKGKKGGGSQ